MLLTIEVASGIDKVKWLMSDESFAISSQGCGQERNQAHLVSVEVCKIPNSLSLLRENNSFVASAVSCRVYFFNPVMIYIAMNIRMENACTPPDLFFYDQFIWGKKLPLRYLDDLF